MLFGAPRVTRLSRKVLIGLGCVSALAVAGALGYALQTRTRTTTGQELLSRAGSAGRPLEQQDAKSALDVGSRSIGVCSGLPPPVSGCGAVT